MAKNHTQPSVVELAEHAKRGEAKALERLLEELQPSVVRTVRLIVGPGSWAAEDAAQDVLLDIARSIGSLRDPRAVRTWAARVAVSRAMKVARRERLARLIPRRYQEPAMPDPHLEGEASALRAAFYALPPRLRAVAILRLFLGLKEIEVADALGCSVGTVKSRLHEARKRLASSLRASGYGPTKNHQVEDQGRRDA